MFIKHPGLMSDEDFDRIFNNQQVDEETLEILKIQVIPLGNFPIKNLPSASKKSDFSGIDFGYEEYYS